MYFQIYGVPKTRLDIYLKSTTSRYLSRSNMVYALKHCSNLHGGTFTIFIDQWEGYSVREIHS